MNRIAYLAQCALLATLTVTAPLIPPVSFPKAAAQSRYAQSIVLPVGTLIPIRSSEAAIIRVPKGKTQGLTLEVAAPIRDDKGNIAIPVGSEVSGQLEPFGNGLRFKAQELRIGNSGLISLNAVSPVITRTEIVRKGASPTDIIAGTLSGAGAGAIIAGTTGDRRIQPLEVLAGAAVGTLAGWGLPQAGILGGKDQEVIVIEPQRDLTLRLRRTLAFAPFVTTDRR